MPAWTLTIPDPLETAASMPRWIASSEVLTLAVSFACVTYTLPATSCTRPLLSLSRASMILFWIVYNWASDAVAGLTPPNLLFVALMNCEDWLLI